MIINQLAIECQSRRLLSLSQASATPITITIIERADCVLIHMLIE